MKKRLLLIAGMIGLLASCPSPDGNPQNNNPDNPGNPGKTLIVFDNTKGICAVSVYRNHLRGDGDKIAEIPAGDNSAEFEWEPGASVPFYFSYTISLKGVSGFTMNYVPREIGKDQQNVRVNAGKKTNITIPRLEETVSSPNDLLSDKSYIFIQNNSSFSFRLHQGTSILSPDNSSAPVVNNGEMAWYTIIPGAASAYQLLVGADYIQFPGSIASFQSGRLYSFVFDGGVSPVSVIEIKVENVAPVPTPGLYRDGVKIGGQNLAESLAYISANAANGDNFSVVIGANENSPPNTLNYSGKTVELTLQGYNGEKTVTLNTNGSLFTVNSGVTLTLDENITLMGRSANTRALVYLDNGKLIVNSGAKIAGNTASGSASVYGGGVYVGGTNASMTMNGGEISGNTASASGAGFGDGGGVYVDNGGTFTMNGGGISGNTASSPNTDGSGGGVYAGKTGNFIMNGGKISGNTTSSPTFSSGGGVHVFGNFTMNGGEISGNTASGAGYGGGVEVFGTFTMKSGKIIDNSAARSGTLGGSGGGVDMYDNGTFTMDDGEISNNTGSFGGGVSVVEAAFTMTGGKITGNTSSNSGGGVYIDPGIFALDGGEISGNTTNYGGGVFVAINATLIMSGGEISGNTATYGGGVYENTSGTFTMDSGKITGNNATTYGGGVYVKDKGNFTMFDGEISGNTTANSGGGVNVENNGTFTMKGGEITGNTSSTSGGGVFLNGTNAVFTKTGGTITGYASDTVNGNAVKTSLGVARNERGHAVYVQTSPVKRREDTAGPEVNLDSKESDAAGGWE